MDQVLNDSTSNIHRRYKHLFTLPAGNRSIIYASVISLATTIVSRIALGASLLELLIFAILTEIALLFSIEIDRRVLSRRTKIATYRRLTTIAIVGNAPWLALTIVGVFIFLGTGANLKLFSLVVLGAFFAAAIRALLIGSLFYPQAWEGLPLAFVQPAILILPTIYSPEIFSSGVIVGNPEPFLAVVGGLLAIAAIELYVSLINGVSHIQNFKPIDLLQAFLNAWAAEDATNLERFLDLVSREGIVKSQMIRIEHESESKESEDALIIVPGPHPGPFYPIGSSNLPFDIFQKLRSPKLIPMIVHSISDHDLNLPSKRQVEQYVTSLNTSGAVESGMLMSSPVVKIVNKARVSGISFGSSVLIAITQAPYGMEDFPIDVKTAIESYSNTLGFKNLLLVDAHNSEGEKPNEKECREAILAVRQALDELKKSKLHPFNAGVAHSSEISEKMEKDIGPAGIALLLFHIPETGESFCLVIADANNSLIGFREKVMEEFETKTSTRILEICTSDTHVTAAKTRDAKGYLALGDVTQVSKFTEILKTLYEKARSRISPSTFSSSVAISNVKTIGGQILNDFSGLLDSASSVGKYGAEVLAILGIVITAIVALV